MFVALPALGVYVLGWLGRVGLGVVSWGFGGYDLWLGYGEQICLIWELVYLCWVWLVLVVCAWAG